MNTDTISTTRCRIFSSVGFHTSFPFLVAHKCILLIIQDASAEERDLSRQLAWSLSQINELRLLQLYWPTQPPAGDF